MAIHLRQIYISPEQIKEREFVKERIIKDDVKKLIDANGKEVLDEKRKSRNGRQPQNCECTNL